MNKIFLSTLAATTAALPLAAEEAAKSAEPAAAAAAAAAVGATARSARRKSPPPLRKKPRVPIPPPRAESPAARAALAAAEADAAAEPAALGACAAEQPALALVTADGLDEAERKLAQLDPALVVWQCDAPGLPALRQCVRLAEGSEAVFLLLVRPGTYEAVWRFVQAAGICVMSWPAPQEVFRQTLRNLLLLKKRLRDLQETAAQLKTQLHVKRRGERP